MKSQLAREKRVNQMARARQYIEWVDAAHVFPCAGPPAFLDDDLFAFNDFDRDPANIFPDQSVFLDLLRAAGIERGELIVPGSVSISTRASARSRTPATTKRRRGRSRTSARTSTSTRRDWAPWLARERAGVVARPA